MGLGRAVDREGIILERIEFRYDAEPGSLGEGREHSGQCGEPGKARKARDADHGRDQDQLVGPLNFRVSECVERVNERECPAVREADDVQWRGRRHALTRFAHCKPCCRNPVIPFHVG